MHVAWILTTYNHLQLLMQVLICRDITLPAKLKNKNKYLLLANSSVHLLGKIAKNNTGKSLCDLETCTRQLFNPFHDNWQKIPLSYLEEIFLFVSPEYILKHWLIVISVACNWKELFM